MVRSFRRFAVTAVLVALMAGAGSGFAAVSAGGEKPFAEQVASWTHDLERARRQLDRPSASDADFEGVRDAAERIRDEALTAWREAQAQADTTRKLLQSLGEPPKEEEPPESPEVAKQRDELKTQLALYEGRMKQADLVATQAGDLLGVSLTARRAKLAEHLLVRGPSPLLPSVWAAAVPQAVTTFVALATVPLQWLASGAVAVQGVYSLAILAAGLLLAVVIGWPLRKWLVRRLGRTEGIEEPSYLRRMIAAVVEGVARGMLPALAVAAVYVTLVSLEMFTETFAPVATGACVALVFFIMVTSLSRAALAPDTPAWQLAPLSPENARAISHTITVLAAVAAVIIFFRQSVDEAEIGVELRVVFNLVTNSMVAAGLMVLLRPRLWRRAEAPGEGEAVEEGAPARPELLKMREHAWPLLRLALALVSVTIPIAALLGYYRLSAYLTSNVVWTGALIGSLWLARELLREVVEEMLTGDERLAPMVRRTLTLSERGARVAQFWTLFGINLVLVAAGIAAALPIWGMTWRDLSGWLQSSAIGLDIERLTFSLGDIFVALLVFIGILVVTRWLQRALEERILPQTRLDAGVRHSLKAVVGYIGLIIAVVAAVSSLGLDLTSLALVAGALSVGIGFGLQAIVSNFMSGLILLIERPVKVGDWVRVGQNEGYVKRISVRATEIETLQRASVIIPNSEILSTAVVNLTHKDRAGRIDIPVGVAYGSETEKVREVLLKCAASHPKVAKWPRPQVIFRNFGDSALEFELRIHLDDIMPYWTVSSEIRFAIDKAFREAGIQIPFPQRDLHIRDLDRLERALGALKAREAGAGEDGAGGGQEGVAPRAGGDGPKKGQA
ncbi:MAG: DUF3772 domain-containing protein [Alphaproteobacteria bacterium]